MKKLIVSLLAFCIFLSSQIYIDANRSVIQEVYLRRNFGMLDDYIKPYERKLLYKKYLKLSSMQFERESSGTVEMSEEEQRLRESFNRKLNQLTYKYLYDMAADVNTEDSEQDLQEKKKQEQADKLVRDLSMYVKKEDADRLSENYEQYKTEDEQVYIDEIREVLEKYPELQEDLILDQLHDPVQIKAYFELDENKELIPMLLLPMVKNLPSEEEQKHYQILWQDIRKVLPNELLKDIDHFMIYTDGVEDTLAFVNYFGHQAQRWYLAVDIKDAYHSEGLAEDFEFTMVHELGHVLTLADEQVDYKKEPVYGQYFEEDMVAKENSYLNQFYQRFWKDIYEDGFISQNLENEEDTRCFFIRHENEFPTEYGSSVLTEDICESFAYFVLEDKPLGDTLKEGKIRFFYEFDELVRIREMIRKKLGKN